MTNGFSGGPTRRSGSRTPESLQELNLAGVVKVVVRDTDEDCLIRHLAAVRSLGEVGWREAGDRAA